MEFLVRLIAKISVFEVTLSPYQRDLQCGDQEVFMKNLVFLRTVTALTPITLVRHPVAEIAPAAVA
jgi:hypothetical protein